MNISIDRSRNMSVHNTPNDGFDCKEKLLYECEYGFRSDLVSLVIHFDSNTPCDSPERQLTQRNPVLANFHCSSTNTCAINSFEKLCRLNSKRFAVKPLIIIRHRQSEPGRGGEVKGMGKCKVYFRPDNDCIPLSRCLIIIFLQLTF